jgi:hypothetical protein
MTSTKRGDRPDNPVWTIGDMKRHRLDFFELARTG